MTKDFVDLQFILFFTDMSDPESINTFTGNQHRPERNSSENSSPQSSRENVSNTHAAVTVSKPVESVAVVNKAEVETSPDKPENANNSNATGIECAVCLQICIHPVKLPCSHIFWYAYFLHYLYTIGCVLY